MTLTPTPEQSNIIEAVTNSPANVMVNAKAGTGKTTTLTMICGALKRVSTLALVFNTRNKTDLEKKLPDWVSVMTINGLGHRAWGRAIGKPCIPNVKKLGQKITALSRELEFDLPEDHWMQVKNLVTMAMQAGLVPSEFKHATPIVQDTRENWQDLADSDLMDLSADGLGFARQVLIQCIRDGFQGDISFDEQIYLPTLFGGAFPRFDQVLVDEAQDLSPMNHLMIKKTSAGRLIVVGDPKQAIYAFRGADHESMERLRGLRKEWVDLPLNLTFRCPRTVVARQQRHAPGYTAAPSNAEGLVVNKAYSDTNKQWDWDDVKAWKAEAATLFGEDTSVAILCRNNAPLMKMAFALIRAGIGPVMLGTEIGKGLQTLSKKILPLDDIPITEAQKLIREWMESEISKAEANGKDEKVSAVVDRGESLLAVSEHTGVATAGDLRTALQRLFSREHGSVTLSSGHRAKGMEWEVVIHLDPWRIPSKYAREAAAAGNDRQLQQEYNLRYVIETRTRHTLALVNGDDFGKDL